MTNTKLMSPMYNVLGKQIITKLSTAALITYCTYIFRIIRISSRKLPLYNLYTIHYIIYTEKNNSTVMHIIITHIKYVYSVFEFII